MTAQIEKGAFDLRVRSRLEFSYKYAGLCGGAGHADAGLPFVHGDPSSR